MRDVIARDLVALCKKRDRRPMRGWFPHLATIKHLAAKPISYIPGKVHGEASPLDATLTNEIKRIKITSHISNH